MPKYILTSEQKAKKAAYQRERRAMYKANGHRDPATFKYQYGISISDLFQMKEKQKNRCAICSNEFKSEHDTCVDHCHTSNKIRALLCRTCNIGLGMFKDNPDLLAKAISYLNAY